MKIFVVLLVLALSVRADENCRFSDEPRFTGTTSRLLFSQVGNAMHLSFCKVSDACSIDWLKDGERLNVSSGRVVAMDELERSLLIPSVEASDEGNYTCVASNNMGTVNRTVEIRVDEEISCSGIALSPETPDWPLRVGGTYWYRWKVTLNQKPVYCSFVRESDHQFVATCSDDSHETVCGGCSRDATDDNVMYASLNISRVREEDLTEYTLMVIDGEGDYCSLPKSSRQIAVYKNRTAETEFQIKDVAASVVPVVLLLVLSSITWGIFKIDIKLYLKDHFGKPELFDGRTYDAYISYTWSDVDRLFVVHLKNHLERRGYRVYVPEVDNIPGGCTVSQIVEALQQSRRFIMVLSPGYFSANFTHYEVNIFIEALNRYKDCIIPIVLEDSASTDSNILFRHVVKVARAVKWTNIEWPLSDQNIVQSVSARSSMVRATAMDNRQNAKVVMEKSFKMRAFKQLLLRMPPASRHHNQDYTVV